MRKRALEEVDVKLETGHLTINGHTISIPNISFIEEIHPRGANGLVFRCTDTVLRRLVAVKIWIPRRDDLRDRSRQALAEASKIAQLNHKNIAQIYQCSQLPNSWIYSVMEYINGVNLDVFIKTKHPDFFQRFRLWKQIEEALKYSHKLGVFHGDLHSGNVLVVDETIKVIDFGTSIFASKRTDSARRETRLLISLSRKMFSTYDPSLSKIIDVDLYVLNPVRALDVLSAWVDILFKWEEIFAVPRSEDWLMTAMHELAFDIMQAPLFSVPHLLQQLGRKGVSINVQNHFIASYLIWADVFLKEPVVKGPHALPYWDFDIGLNPRANKARLKRVIPSLHEAFYEKGPFH